MKIKKIISKSVLRTANRRRRLLCYPRGNMKKKLNKTSAYAFIIALLNLYIAYSCKTIFKSFVEYWNHVFEGEPLPFLSEKIAIGTGSFIIFGILIAIFILAGILSTQEGKKEIIAFHLLMLGILCDIFYLFCILFAMVLPEMAMTIQIGG